MEFHVEARNKQLKRFVERILPSMIKQLGLVRSKKLLLVKVSRTEMVEDNDGMTAPIKALNSIVVIIRPASLEKIGVTLAHEMVHVKQIAKGTLKSVNGVNYWKGKRYSKRTKYLNLPWEIEAFSKQELIFRRAID